ncbi:GIY-YIG nuclease family protein [Yoonia sp. BS5-3]|uniref:GIY-YIG nuclease family protein n=1 Tax=Yoonia phaeophyticola TaxID=3137369 RepID=A0ABZ2VBS8_9RHOB
MTALYVGTTLITDQWAWDGDRLPHIQDMEIIDGEMGRENVDAFDLEWIEQGSEYAERLLINWGPGGRAWSQRAHRMQKAILEIRLQAEEPPFPGFSGFLSRISEIPRFPQAWAGSLEGARGVYLLVADNGDQYVGSATGLGGFMGRWRQYLLNGHGGNVRLREAGQQDYQVAILEVASPDMSLGDILAREAFWKTKLGVRAHGLNAN